MTDLISSKNCSKCKEDKSLSSFNNSQKVLNYAVCSPCLAAYAKQWNLKNKERNTAKQALYREKNREKRRDYNAQYRKDNKQKILLSRKEYSIKNAKRISEKSRRDYFNNREHHLERTKEYQRKNPLMMKAVKHRRRARQAAADGSFTSLDVKEIYKLQKWKCGYCKTSIKDGYHIDHIIPIVRGGTNFRSNIQLLCQRCNNQKCAKDPIDFAQTKGLLL
jgi:5-methylcytosine-specific restriction endonuclease McrA